jgi:hypothetical protein
MDPSKIPAPQSDITMNILTKHSPKTLPQGGVNEMKKHIHNIDFGQNFHAVRTTLIKSLLLHSPSPHRSCDKIVFTRRMKNIKRYRKKSSYTRRRRRDIGFAFYIYTNHLCVRSI